MRSLIFIADLIVAVTKDANLTQTNNSDLTPSHNYTVDLQIDAKHYIPLQSISQRAFCLWSAGYVEAQQISGPSFRCVLPSQTSDIVNLRLWYWGSIHGPALTIPLVRSVETAVPSRTELSAGLMIHVTGGPFLTKYPAVVILETLDWTLELPLENFNETYGNVMVPANITTDIGIFRV